MGPGDRRDDVRLEGGVRGAATKNELPLLSLGCTADRHYFRLLYGTEQYLLPFVQYRPLIDGKGDGAENPLFPPIFVCLLELRCDKNHPFMSPCVWS